MKNPTRLALLSVLGLTLASCFEDRPLLVAQDDAGTPAGAAGTTGAAGTGAAGTSTAGTSGTAGTGAAGKVASCDVAPLIRIYNCALAGACHDNKGSAAGLDLASAGFAAKLVGELPGTAAGHTIETPSICAGDPVYENMAYITKPTTAGGHAGGLILAKLRAAVCSPSGIQMPSTGPPYLSAIEIECFQKWADALVAQ